MVTCKETRAAIIALHKNGFTGKDIVATKIAPKSTIYRIIKNFKERGSILVKKASGRPRKSSKRQDRLLKRIQLRDRSATSAELAQEWQQAGVSASARTVRRRLLEDGLVSRRAAKKPLLSKKNIRDRLIFCKKYGEWTAEDWGKVIFSDEASFRLFGASGKRLVRRRKGERYHQSCVMPKRQVDKQKPINSDKLQEVIMKEWVAISQDLAQKLIESMPSRIAEVLKKKGQHCKY
ncbi:transposase-like protein [Labeo rohita]|uniref:Transposase-like protein n=1 Tax=Labeo rohita TaxID=84645 RepID=A0A498M5C4_LABRO|nr:transposase-like protein [Labeo rohita]